MVSLMANGCGTETGLLTKSVRLAQRDLKPPVRDRTEKTKKKLQQLKMVKKCLHLFEYTIVKSLLAGEIISINTNKPNKY